MAKSVLALPHRVLVVAIQFVHRIQSTMNATRSIDVTQRRFIPLWESIVGFLTLILPGSAFVWGLTRVSGRPGFVDLARTETVPSTLWTIGVAGTIALIAGLLDLHYHVTGQRIVSKRERHGELVALGLGGAPLLVLMMLASVAENPARLFTPIVIVLGFTVVMVCLDEFVYHRKACTPYEATLHRVIVFGNGAAFLAWFHWITNRG